MPSSTPAQQPSDTEQFAASTTAHRGVVVGVDGSASADAAARWAAQEARRRELPLTIVHAVHLPEADAAPYEPDDFAPRLRAEGRALLARAAARINALYPDLPVTAELSDRAPAHALEAASRTASLIVTGTRGRGGFTGMLLGSTSRALAAHGRCPLIVVPGEVPEDGGNEIVLGVGHRHSEAAIRYAFEAARYRGASLIVVRSWWPSPAGSAIAAPGGMFVADPEIFRDAALAETRTAIKAVREQFPDVAVRVEVGEGNAVDLLLGAARRTSLLVVGAHRHRGPLAVGAGYVVDGVITHSPIPVAVVPGRIDGTGPDAARG